MGNTHHVFTNCLNFFRDVLSPWFIQAWWRQYAPVNWTVSLLVQVMACSLFGNIFNWTVSKTSLVKMNKNTKDGSFKENFQAFVEGSLWLLYRIRFEAMITMTTHERHGVSNHRQIDCLFKSLFNLYAQGINKAPPYWPFVKGIYRSPVDFPHKGQW